MISGRFCVRAQRLAAIIVLSGAMFSRGAAQASPSRPAVPVKIAVVGTDYAFLPLPGTIAPGPTLFGFENRGRVRHEMSVALLKPGATVEQVIQSGAAAQRLYERIIGILIARPGEASGGQLFVELDAGRTYVMLCTLRDTPDDRPHLTLGMITSFTVR